MLQSLKNKSNTVLQVGYQIHKLTFLLFFYIILEEA